MKIFIEDTAGERFECDLDPNTTVGTLAAEFFEHKQWPELDGRGRGQRAVVELVQIAGPAGRSKAIRLKPDQTLADAEIGTDATLRIFPEAIAGAMDTTLRITRLVSDLREVENLCEDNEDLDFEANDEYAPSDYIIYMYYETFIERPLLGQRPATSDEHKISIKMPADYPTAPPLVQWMTPIFHPNIHPQERVVCLGKLQDQYVPTMGLGKLISMLIEIVQWRNFGIKSPYNPEAAAWASDPNNWEYIREIGGSPLPLPWQSLIDPRYWGDNALPSSPFLGRPQPEELLHEWEMKQKHKLKFIKTNKTTTLNA